MLDKYMNIALVLILLFFPFGQASAVESKAEIVKKGEVIHRSEKDLNKTVLWFECETFDFPNDNGKWFVIISQNEAEVMKYPVNFGDSWTGIGKIMGGIDFRLKNLPNGKYNVMTTNGNYRSDIVSITIKE